MALIFYESWYQDLMVANLPDGRLLEKKKNNKSKGKRWKIAQKIGLHRILIWPVIREKYLPDIRLNSNIEFRKKCTFI